MKGILIALVATNILYLIIGLSLIGVGTYAQIDKNLSAVLNKLSHSSSFDQQSLGYVGFITIGGGVFTVIIAALGLWGTLRNKKRCLISYIVLVTIMVILEFAGFIMVFAYQEELEDVYRHGLYEAFITAAKTNETDVLDAFHDLETAAECCGIESVLDYTKANLVISPACYKYKKGCADALIDLFTDRFPTIGAVLIVVVLIELMSIIGAIIFLIHLRKNADEEIPLSPIVALTRDRTPYTKFD